MLIKNSSSSTNGMSGPCQHHVQPANSDSSILVQRWCLHGRRTWGTTLCWKMMWCSCTGRRSWQLLEGWAKSLLLRCPTLYFFCYVASYCCVCESTAPGAPSNTCCTALIGKDSLLTLQHITGFACKMAGSSVHSWKGHYVDTMLIQHHTSPRACLPASQQHC